MGLQAVILSWMDVDVDVIEIVIYCILWRKDSWVDHLGGWAAG